MKEEIVKLGICVYNDLLEYKVKIVKSHVFYGSGDYEDSPEICNDQEIDCYYVWYENVADKGNFNTGGGGFLSIVEAMAGVEQKSNFKLWLE